MGTHYRYATVTPETWAKADVLARRFCRRLMVGSVKAGHAVADDADDLTQRTLMRIHRYPFDPARGKSLLNYVAKQAVFAASSRLRDATRKCRSNHVDGVIIPDLRLDDPGHHDPGFHLDDDTAGAGARAGDYDVNSALARDDPGMAAVDADVGVAVVVHAEGDVVDAVAAGARAVVVVDGHAAVVDARAIVFVFGIAVDSGRWRLAEVVGSVCVWSHR